MARLRIRFKFFGQFRELVGQGEVGVDVTPGAGLQEALKELIGRYPLLEGKILDTDGRLGPHAIAFVNGCNTRTMRQPSPALVDGDTVLLTQAIAGG